ncbi:MAG: hypothetical protein WCJ30_10970, partial [Deltaproteobacteria bacterium]
MTPAEKRAYGGLLLSCAGAGEMVLGVRPIHWFNSIVRLGVMVPMYIVHDLGSALLGGMQKFAPRADLLVNAAGVTDATRALLAGPYHQLLTDLANTDASEQLRKAAVDDAVITTLLTRVLSPISDRWKGGRGFEPVTLDTEELTHAMAHLGAAWTGVDRRMELDYLQHIVDLRLHLLLAIEQIDLDTLELLRLFGRDAGMLPETELVDLLSVFSSPEANDIVNFSLDILPSVLETHRGGGQQIFSVDGYSGVVSNGSLDSLVMTEMAYDDELFEQRFLDNEMLYYAHEAQVRPP